jgi:zinc D-Ala-D-Ala carboxypeptidase
MREPLIVTDWSLYRPYFTEAEFACTHTGHCRMNTAFMDTLLRIRLRYARRMSITSGFRDRTHPLEARKTHFGDHAQGTGADVSVAGSDALDLLRIALEEGITRIGIQQKGAHRFVHLGMGGGGLPSPMIWSY